MYIKKSKPSLNVVKVFFLFLLLAFFSCGNNNKVAELVPKDAKMVVELNISSMVEKVFMSSISGHTINMNGILSQKLQPHKLGLSITNKAYTFIYDKTSPKLAFCAMLDSRLKFEEYIKTVGTNFIENPHIEKIENNLSMCRVSAAAIIVWDAKRVLMIVGSDKNKLISKDNGILLFEQKESIVDLDFFKKNIADKKEDISLITNDFSSEIISPFLPEIMNNLNLDFLGKKSISSISFHDGEWKLRSTLLDTKHLKFILPKENINAKEYAYWQHKTPAIAFSGGLLPSKDIKNTIERHLDMIPKTSSKWLYEVVSQGFFFQLDGLTNKEKEITNHHIDWSSFSIKKTKTKEKYSNYDYTIVTSKEKQLVPFISYISLMGGQWLDKKTYNASDESSFYIDSIRNSFVLSSQKNRLTAYDTSLSVHRDLKRPFFIQINPSKIPFLPSYLVYSMKKIDKMNGSIYWKDETKIGIDFTVNFKYKSRNSLFDMALILENISSMSE